MKDKITVGLFGKLHGLHPKLMDDLPNLGFAPFEIDPEDLAHPPGTVAVICTLTDSKLHDLSLLIESLRDDQVQLIYVSIAGSNQPEAPVTDFGRLGIKAEAQIRGSGIPYTIVRAMSAEDRPGHHHKIYWKQDVAGQQKGPQHPVPWEDLAEVLAHCVSRAQALSKTFTLHSVAGAPLESEENWDQWFKGLSSDPTGSPSVSVSA